MPPTYVTDSQRKAARLFYRLLIRNRANVSDGVLGDLRLIYKGRATSRDAQRRLYDLAVENRNKPLTLTRCALVAVTSNYSRYYLGKAMQMAYAIACTRRRGKTELKCQRRDLLEVILW